MNKLEELLECYFRKKSEPQLTSPLIWVEKTNIWASFNFMKMISETYGVQIENPFYALQQATRQ